MGEIMDINMVTSEVAPEEAVADLNETEFDENVYNDASDAMDAIEEFVGDEGFADDSTEEFIEDDLSVEPDMYEDEFIDEYVDPGFIDGEYFDPGFYDGGYMEPGMDMGMAEVNDPLLSSWPFVIGISLAVLVVSIGLGALLAKLKIKKGIDLYED